LKLHILEFRGSKFILNEYPGLRLFTGPKMILSNRNVGME